jgi:DHA2 family methylenomycin A resistance protein-like MFS transporter
VVNQVNAPDQTVTSPRVVLTVMCAGYFLVLLDVTVVNVALPSIGDGLGSSVDSLQWVVDSYALALAVLLLAGGTLGDLRGHKRVVLTGLTVFGAASLACALAPTSGVLVVARAVQGVGAALMLPGTLAIISRTYPARAEQARAIGIWAAVGSVALPAGPLVGGLLVESVGWRWVFLANVPVVVVACLVTVRAVAPDPGRGSGSADRAGVALAALALAGLIFAVIHAGREGVDVVAVMAAAVALAGLVAFVVAERRAVEPMLPLSLFRRPAFAVANSVAGVMNLGTLGLLFLLTLYLQSVQSRSAIAAGLAALPLFLPLTLLAPAAGRVTGRLGPRPVMLAGLALAGVGVALLATWKAGSSYPVLLPALLCWGVGLAALTPAVVAAAISAVPPESAGLASGVNNTARQAGGAVGIAAYGAVAGPPANVSAFMSGLHATGLATAGLFLLAAVATALGVPGRVPENAA